MLHLRLNINKADIHYLMNARLRSDIVKPELVLPEEVRKSKAYARFQDLDEKSAFRERLLRTLSSKLASSISQESGGSVESFQALFLQLCERLEEDGAVIFADLINQGNFAKLLKSYTEIMDESGSLSWIHSYVNLGNHPEHLSAPAYNQAFLHPLLIAMIAYQVGGPIRIVDARAKDAEPISVLAQDNMLHIDNTPFREEYKIIVTWEKGKVSGPKGQNFVFIPGTHKAVRNCLISENDGSAYSTENGSIFITDDAIDQVFTLQKQFTETAEPMVVEATHPIKPLTTVFAAGALVHHRYRTTESETSRSCMIIAIHRAKDYPGELINSESLTDLTVHDPLMNYLLGQNTGDDEAGFIAALTDKVELIAEKITEIFQEIGPCEVISAKYKTLNEEELQAWKRAATSAPSVEKIKINNGLLSWRIPSEVTAFSSFLTEMMCFDKHGSLDLILYEDGREEPRKWARNKIREMNIEAIANHLAQWKDSYGYLSEVGVEDLLTPETLAEHCLSLVNFIDSYTSEIPLFLDASEKTSKEFALRSIRQLFLDLSEAIQRCVNRQGFLSTSLFVFMAVNVLRELCNQPFSELPELKIIGTLLLKNYIATAALCRTQIEHESNIEPRILNSRRALITSKSAMFAGAADYAQAVVAFDFDKTIAFPHSDHPVFLHEGSDLSNAL